jgi:hypothetical protein
VAGRAARRGGGLFRKAAGGSRGGQESRGWVVEGCAHAQSAWGSCIVTPAAAAAAARRDAWLAEVSVYLRVAWGHDDLCARSERLSHAVPSGTDAASRGARPLKLSRMPRPAQSVECRATRQLAHRTCRVILRLRPTRHGGRAAACPHVRRRPGERLRRRPPPWGVAGPGRASAE